VQTTAQYEQSRVSSVNELLGLVYALLAPAVLIALIGIVNTLMLSVFERTREIGLLRAAGMQRGQVRMMIRSESVTTAAFGAVVGIVSGTLLGLAFSAALRRQGGGMRQPKRVLFRTSIALAVLAAAVGLTSSAALASNPAARSSAVVRSVSGSAQSSTTGFWTKGRLDSATRTATAEAPPAHQTRFTSTACGR
jgi:putative ABC transport system permease protein